MEEYFASKQITNSSVLCVGSITRSEAELAQDTGLNIDGFGYYLFLASQAEPKQPVEVLAKFASEGAAEKLARMFLKSTVA